MSDNFATNCIVDEVEVDEDDASQDDFTFVIGPDGSLKTMMIPEHLMSDPPEEIQCILALFGIDDVNLLEGRTLH